jgi:PAS domain-containing protein
MVKLEQLGTRQIVFASLPATADDAFFVRALEYGNVVFGRRIKAPSHPGDKPELEPWPAPFAGKVPPFGVTTVPNGELGIHRYASTSVRIDNKDIPTLSVAAAQFAGVDLDVGQMQRYLVNFNRGAEWLPSVRASRVLDDKLIPELVVDRSVIIGERRSSAQPGLYTPATVDGTNISLLAFQAFALDTLLTDTVVRKPSKWMTLGLLLAVLLLSLVVYQWIPLVAGAWAASFLMIAYATMSWICLHAFRIWIPAIELLLAQLMLSGVFIRFRLARDEQEVRRALLERAARIRAHVLPPSFNTLQGHWAQVITLVDQTLNLSRLIFLEKVPSDHRVREVQALRCSVDDIDERRRDYERTPYSTAIAEGGPIRLKKIYLIPRDDMVEDQYLVPLLFGGEVGGFWAFGVDPEVVKQSDRFLSNVRDFGSQIAELLYRRHLWMQRREAESGLLRRLFRLEAGKKTYREVENTMSLLDKRLAALESIFEGVGTATILYDLFGRVVHVNRSMEEFMHAIDVPGFDMTALNFLVAVTGMQQDEARLLLQEVVLDRNQYHLPTTLMSKGGASHSMHIRALVQNAEARPLDAASPFELFGILFEFVDITRFKSMFNSKDQLLERLVRRVQDDLEGMLQTTQIAKEPIALRHLDKVAAGGNSQTVVAMQSADDRTPVDGAIGAVMLEHRIYDTLSMLSRVEDSLTSDTSKLGNKLEAIDSASVLRRMIESLSDDAARQRIDFEIRYPESVGLTLAQSDKLDDLFRAILDVLMRDAATDTSVVADIREDNGIICFEFLNSGFGIPDQHLQAYLWDPAYSATEEFRELRESLRPVRDWDGEVEAHSDVGRGITITLKLRVLI